MEQQVPPRILLTILGAKLRKRTYSLDQSQAEANSSPAALSHLLTADQQPQKILAICTTAARANTFPTLELDSNVECEAIEVPDASEPEDLQIMLHAFMAKVPEQAELMLDISHGYRHFSLLTYIAALYVGVLKSSRLVETFCAQFTETTGKIYRLPPLVSLPDWLYQTRSFIEKGAADGLSQLIFSLPEKGKPLQSLQSQLRKFHAAYAAAVPLELFNIAANLAASVPKAAPELKRLMTGGDDLIRHIGSAASPFAVLSVASKKAKVPLTEELLEMQAQLIDTYLRREDFNSAFGLMSEWMITRVLHGQRATKWLEYKDRRPAESELHALLERREKKILESEYDEIATLWQELKEMRNLLHHHGMRNESYSPKGARWERITDLWGKREGWQQLLAFPPRPSLGTVLICAHKKPGPLFSALKLTQPDFLKVICSEESEPSVASALEHASYEGKTELYILEDPFIGFEQLDYSALARELIGATEVLVSATGGTTLMRLMATKLGSEAARLGVPVRTFGLIDKRTKALQETDPFVLGELFWMDESR